MTKFSIIIPHFNRLLYLEHCIDSLCNQTFRDFEIIIIGDKVLRNDEADVDGIKLKNIIYKDGHEMAKMLNLAIKEAKGEFIQIWQADFAVYPDHFKKLNLYTNLYGKNFLYTGRVLDTRGCDGRVARNEFIYIKPDPADHGDGCFHRDIFEPFYEGFFGLYTHVYIDWLHRLWNKGITFLYFKDLEVIHFPHRAPLHAQAMESVASFELYQKMGELGFDYKRYNELEEASKIMKERVKNINYDAEVHQMPRSY